MPRSTKRSETCSPSIANLSTLPSTPDCSSTIRVDSDPLGSVSLPVKSLHGAQADLARENERLRLENRVLKEERDILKKATQFLASQRP